MGATYLVALPPYYYPCTGDELRSYFEQLAERTGGPLVLYDIPALTKLPVPLDVLDALSRDPRIVCYKDSRNDMAALWETIRRFEGREDFDVMVGFDYQLADAVLAGVTGGGWADGMVPPTEMRGAAGGVCGSANVWPQLLVAIYDAARAGDLGALAPLRRQVKELCTIYQAGGGWGYVAGVKAACECLGLCECHVLPPLGALDRQRVEKIRSVLVGLGLVQ
jgi:4-hydroxy-tetrahydrodipicolinate synthase